MIQTVFSRAGVLKVKVPQIKIQDFLYLKTQFPQVYGDLLQAHSLKTLDHCHHQEVNIVFQQWIGPLKNFEKNVNTGNFMSFR